MKWNKKVFLVTTVAMLALSVAGCGETKETEPTDVKALIEKAQATMETVNSMSADMIMEMDMGLGEEVYETTTTARILARQEPLKMQIDMTFEATDEQGPQEIQVFAEAAEDELLTYSTLDDVWYAQRVEIEEMEQYNAGENMELYLEHIEAFQAAGEEEINGIPTTKIEGIITGDALEDAIEDSGLKESAENMGLSEDMLEGIYTDLKDMPVFLWIDGDGYVRKYELDMTEMMQKIMDTAMQAVGLTETEIAIDILKTNISMTCGEFNEIEEIQIPEEAKKAPVEDLTEIE